MIILKRIKNKLEYFYLQHSFRENNRIITKEKYLGRIIPKNIEEIKREFFKQFENNINKKLGAVKNNFQAEWIRIPDSIKDKQLN